MPQGCKHPGAKVQILVSTYRTPTAAGIASHTGIASMKAPNNVAYATALALRPSERVVDWVCIKLPSSNSPKALIESGKGGPDLPSI